MGWIKYLLATMVLKPVIQIPMVNVDSKVCFLRHSSFLSPYTLDDLRPEALLKVLGTMSQTVHEPRMQICDKQFYCFYPKNVHRFSKTFRTELRDMHIVACSYVADKMKQIGSSPNLDNELVNGCCGLNHYGKSKLKSILVKKDFLTWLLIDR